MKNPNANSDQIARKYLDSLVVEQRVLGAGAGRKTGGRDGEDDL